MFIKFTTIPEWAKGACYYQFLVDRFAKSEDHPNNLISGRSYRSWGDEVNWRRNSEGKFQTTIFSAEIKRNSRKNIIFYSSGYCT